MDIKISAIFKTQIHWRSKLNKIELMLYSGWTVERIYIVNLSIVCGFYGIQLRAIPRDVTPNLVLSLCPEITL